MEFGVVVPTYGPWADAVAVRDGVQAAEDLGYQAVWFGDHVVVPSYAVAASAESWFEPLTCAAVMAGATSRILLGTDVLVLPYRPPVLLSQMIATADRLSGGRLMLGVGVGWISKEFEAVGAPPYERRGPVTEEFIAVMRHLWEQTGPLAFEGEWAKFEDVYADPKPLQTPFPLLIGGNASIALRRAALLGNGWHPLFPTPEVYASSRAKIMELRETAGLTDPFTFSYSCPPTQLLSAPHRGTKQNDAARDELPKEFQYVPTIPTAPDGRLLFKGTPDELIETFDSLEAAGVDQVALRFSDDDALCSPKSFGKQLEKFAESVMPKYAPSASAFA